MPNANETTATRLLGVRVVVCRLLPDGVYALTKGSAVVWDSATRQPAGVNEDPTKWDGVLVSPEWFERLKEAPAP